MINERYSDKINEAYKNLKQVTYPIEFAPNSPYYHQEEWKEVLTCYIPGVLPHTYWISNMGRIYTNLKSPKYPNGGIMVHCINQKGYHQINLMSADHRKIGVKIHRLVMLHFNFVLGCQYFEVDHLDGDKDNNCLWNLEWVTPQENTHRAINNNQRTLAPFVNENSKMLTDLEAKYLFYEAYVLGYDYLSLSNKYGVSFQYIDYLVKGFIRPYILRKYQIPISFN